MELQGDGAAAIFSWTAAEGGRESWAQAVRLRDGLIVHMQDFADPGKARRAIRRTG